MKTEGETKHGIIANLLVRGGLVDAASLDRAVQIQTAKGGTLPRILSSLGLADEEKACATIADGLRLSYLEPDAISGLGDAAMSLLPADFSRERLVLALGIEGGPSGWRWPIRSTTERCRTSSSAAASGWSRSSRRRPPSGRSWSVP